MSTIYRYKFSDAFTASLMDFANTYRYDDTPEFREAWSRWCLNNQSIVTEEDSRLANLGYDKDINIKMYKSVRYYFKNKSSEQKPPKKRRQYIMIEQEILNLMSDHIENHAFNNNYKPEFAYNNFVSNSLYNNGLDEEIERLQDEYTLSELEVEKKIKKTYKNRYYLKQKQIH